MNKPEYSFDIDGHTVVKNPPEKRASKSPPEWLSQALNEDDGVYRP